MNKIFVVAIMLVASILTGNLNAYAANTGDVIITEIGFSSSDTRDWFEIYNASAGAITIDNTWLFRDQDGVDWSPTGSYALAAENCLTFGRQNALAAEYGTGFLLTENQDVTGWGLILAGALSVYEGGTLIDIVDWDDNANGWSNFTASDNFSIQLLSGAFNANSNDSANNWFSSDANNATVFTGGAEFSPYYATPGAVPEPSAMMLLIPGLFAVLCLRRIKK